MGAPDRIKRVPVWNQCCKMHTSSPAYFWAHSHVVFSAIKKKWRRRNLHNHLMALKKACQAVDFKRHHYRSLLKKRGVRRGAKTMARIDWVALEKVSGGQNILEALHLALRRVPITDIARQAKVPESSLYSIKNHGPYAHRERKRQNAVAAK